MIRDEWQIFVYCLLAVAVVLWTIALFGCTTSKKLAILPCVDPIDNHTW